VFLVRCAIAVDRQDVAILPELGLAESLADPVTPAAVDLADV
jgi:hypothetical protein